MDGLRAVAILTVITYHFGFDEVPGDLGVTLFFVLSGFLITRLLLVEFRKTASINFTSFHQRRLLKIFPAYYLFLLTTFVEECLRGYCWSVGLLVAGITQVVNYYNAFNGHPNTTIAHIWALSLQEQFYLVWPVIFLVLMKRGMRSFVWGLVFSIVGVMLWRVILSVEVGATHAYLYNALDTRFDSLAIGCLLGVMTEFPGLIARVGIVAVSSLMPLATLIILLISRSFGSTAYHYSVGFTVDTILLAVFVLQMLLLHKHWMWAWLDHPSLKFVGRISYSLYLWHLLCIGIINHFAFVPVAPRFLLAIMMCLGLASVSYWFVERPFLKMKERLKAIAV